jgi:hypothetical protein
MKVTIASDFRDIFRSLTDSEFEQAKENNLADPDHEHVPPIAIWQCGKEWIVADGHHTLKIRESLRVNGKPVKIRYRKMEFADRQAALAYAIRAQLGRRNLDPSQVAMALAKLPKAKHGGDRRSDQVENLPLDRESIASANGISGKTLRSADKVHEHGAKAIQEAVKDGDVTVSDAAAIATLPKPEQVAALQKVTNGKAKTLKAAAEVRKDAPGELAKKNKALAHSLRDKLARAICDYHAVKPNKGEKDRLVKLVQGVELW